MEPFETLCSASSFPVGTLTSNTPGEAVETGVFVGLGGGKVAVGGRDVAVAVRVGVGGAAVAVGVRVGVRGREVAVGVADAGKGVAVTMAFDGR